VTLQVKDQGSDQREGEVNGSLIKFLSQETNLCPTFKTQEKPLKKSDEKH
jgi:hypothetical protein